MVGLCRPVRTCRFFALAGVAADRSFLLGPVARHRAAHRPCRPLPKHGMPLVRAGGIVDDRRVVSRLVVHRLSLAQFRLLANPQLPVRRLDAPARHTRSQLGAAHGRRLCSGRLSLRRNRQALPALAAAIFILTAPALVPDGHRQSGGELRVSLLQGNVAQTLKWDPDQVIKALSDYQKMAQETGEQLIILPETAWPVPFYSLPQEYVAGWHDIATEQQGVVIAGVFLEEGDDTYNAAVLLDGEQVKDYRKTHLTPYGEYQPFPDLARRWLRSEAIQFSGLTAGEENKTLTLPGGTQAGMSICYEDAFGDEWREQLPHAHFLVNITNDAWFDTTAMPYQHLQISQARALETGRWLVRAANTGVTAIINERGEVVRALPLKSQEALTGTIQLRQGATPYVLIGDTGIALIAGLMLLAAAVVDRRKRASPNS